MSRSRSVVADADNHVVDQGDYPPTVRDAHPHDLVIGYRHALASREGLSGAGELILDNSHHCDERLAARAGCTDAGRGGGADPDDAALMAHPVAKYRPIVRPEILYRYTDFSPTFTPTPNDIDRVCDQVNTQQLNECTDLFIELMGWGVSPEYLADSGFSLPGVIWLCAKCRLRLTEGIVKRAELARIPLHHLSIMPGDS